MVGLASFLTVRHFSTRHACIFDWIVAATRAARAALLQTAIPQRIGVSAPRNGSGELHGRDVAAAYTLGPDQKEHGVPPHWMLYVAVENADSSAEKSAGLGAKILAPPFDVFDVSRMAVIQDPTGAVFAIWQAKRHHGIDVTSEECGFCWADLATTDPRKAADFYSQLFGWETEVSKNDPSGYLHILNKGSYIGGIPPVLEGQGPPHWLIYYQVSEIATLVERANSNGGKTYQPPFTVPDTGQIAVLADAQSAVFALFEPMQKR
jgi:uncharacterized protein